MVVTMRDVMTLRKDREKVRRQSSTNKVDRTKDSSEVDESSPRSPKKRKKCQGAGRT